MHVDILWLWVSRLSARQTGLVCTWVANSHIKKKADLCLSKNFWATISSYASGVLSAPLFNSSPVFGFNIPAHHAKPFRLQIPQFIIVLDDKSTPFWYHSVIHIENVPTKTQTEGVSRTSQWYLSLTASRSSLLFFKSKSISLIGKTVS